jgi:hypothetical protein
MKDKLLTFLTISLPIGLIISSDGTGDLTNIGLIIYAVPRVILSAEYLFRQNESKIPNKEKLLEAVILNIITLCILLYYGFWVYAIILWGYQIAIGVIKAFIDVENIIDKLD